MKLTFQIIGRSLIDFPLYALSYLLGFIPVVLTEVDSTTLALVSVLVGLALGSVLWGAIVFLGGHLLIRTLGRLAGALADPVHRLANNANNALGHWVVSNRESAAS
jgi:hypothetical protein